MEDDEQVRGLAARSLRARGYRVVEASDGQDALSHLSDLDAIDLLITDIVMPGIGGSEVAKRLRATKPTLPVLFVSGYADEVMARGGVAARGEFFLAKPFSLGALRRAVEDALAPEAASRCAEG
ncbi:MAG: response regulator [Myxococcales bacterium]|nr:response regulator [Myxococcales bacterium]MDD9965161.1 response regulator [Myxococcales bacterium]